MKKYLTFKKQSYYVLSRLTHIIRIFIFIFVFSITFNGFSKIEIVKADATSQVNVSIDYADEVAIITPSSGGSTKFYMSMDGKKTWEAVDDTGRVDLSTILTTKGITVYFKGNKDSTPREFFLKQEDKNFQVSYKVVSGAGLIAITPAQTIEYKNGVNGTWKIVTSEIATSIYEIKGATLYFRTPATSNKFASKVISLKIPKRPAAPSVKLDGSKLSVTGLKAGQTQYRVGDSTTWLPFNPTDSKSKSISLYTLFISSTATNIVIPAGRIELRTLGNEKKPNSSIKVIEVSTQPVVPETISLTNSTLTITDNDKKRVYEYTRVAKGSFLNLETAKWTTASSTKPVVIKNASVGDKIYVRLKSRIDPTSKQLILASTYKELIITQIR